MIVDFRPSCPLQKSTHHAKPDPYTLSDQELLSYPCPNCGSIGSLQKNKTYRRFFAENTEDIKRSCSIMVQVYYCPACQTYHSLFHPSVVPFCSYSYAFLGEIYRFYNECKNFAQTAKKFLLSVKVLHSLIRKIQSDLNLLQRITADFLLPSSDSDSCASSELCRFHLKHGYPLFCSSHKNSFRPPYYVKRFLFIFFR